MGFFAEGTHREPVDDNGHWVEFRNNLTFGDVLDMASEAPMGEAPGDRMQRQLASLKAYLADWHLTREDGSPVPFSVDAITELDPDFGFRLLDLLNAHVGRQMEGKALAAPAPPTSTSSNSTSTPT